MHLIKSAFLDFLQRRSVRQWHSVRVYLDFPDSILSARRLSTEDQRKTGAEACRPCDLQTGKLSGLLVTNWRNVQTGSLTLSS